MYISQPTSKSRLWIRNSLSRIDICWAPP